MTANKFTGTILSQTLFWLHRLVNTFSYTMTTESHEKVIAERLQGLLGETDARDLRELVLGSHPADLAGAFATLDEEDQEKLLELWPTEAVAPLLAEMAEHFAADYFESVPPRVAARALAVLPADDAADLLLQADPLLREKIIENIPAELAEDIRALLSYPEDTAGGRMSLDFVSLPPDVDVETARGLVKQSIGEELHTLVYLVDSDAHLVGVATMEKLASTPRSRPVKDLIEPDYPRVSPAQDQEELASLFKRYDLLSVPVVDETGVLLGEVTFDDVLEIVHEEATEDIFKMVGTSDEELEVRGAFSVVRLRLPWLLICLLGALLSGTIIHLFSFALEQVVALASFIPVITAMGGNAGLQSSTVVIRNLALGRVEGGSILRAALRELRVGSLLGLFSGMIVGGVAWAVGGNPMLGVVVGTAMIGAIIVATLMGAFMPLFFRRLGADPAVASGPFITTANDMTGLTIYLGLGMLLLKFLV